MDKLVYNTATHIWHEIAKNFNEKDLSLEIELHKKLLNFFQVGDSYYYIFYCPTSTIEYVNDAVCDVLGYKKEDFNIANMLNIIHPDDINYFIDFQSAIATFFHELPPEKVLKYKVRYDYRLRKANGEYIRILQQVIIIQSGEDGGVIRALGMHTDISHLKKENKSALSFIGLEGEPSFLDVKVKSIFAKDILSAREKEVLSLIIKGHTSQQIADHLFISKLTVDSHRKKLLQKTNCSSTYELISKTIHEGWI